MNFHIGDPPRISVSLKSAMDAVGAKSLFYPAAGDDIAPFLTHFHPWLRDFHFNDLTYTSSADCNWAPPEGFTMGRTHRPDKLLRDAPIETRRDGDRHWYWLSPTELRQEMISPHGLLTSVRKRRGFGQYALMEQERSSIGVFVHRNDSSVEGGSKMYFLANKPSCHEPLSNLWDKLNERLADQAIVISDGCLTGFKFLKRVAALPIESPLPDVSFLHKGRYWRPIDRMPDRRRAIIWSVVRA